ncbi:MAG: hypothetical protein JW807_07750 [Spirochaetes bacterium]|nr:hypothetical protein [Spirochaetota bacterium]
MVKRLSLIMIITALSMFDVSARVKPGPDDSVEWGKGVIVAFGTARVPISGLGKPVSDEEENAEISLNRGRVGAYRKARERAVANLARLVRDIRVDADTTLSDLLDRNEDVQSRIGNIISTRVKVVEYPVDFATSGCRAELKIGDILNAVPYTYPADDFPIRIDNPIATDYTGLIINAKGLPVRPMILPSVYSEEGLEVYGRFNVDIRQAGKFGIVAYAFSEDDAMKFRAAGAHPYYTVALKEMKGCPVLSDRDVRKIFSSRSNLEMLKKCRVIFIIDKPKK